MTFSSASDTMIPRPTLREMLGLWLPLAASLVMMVLEPSIINIGLSRTTEPELALAAYGVAFSLALLLEAPILMLLDASVARSTTVQAFSVIRRFTLILGFAVTGIGMAISLTPLYDLIVPGLMNIPGDVAAMARPTLQILSLWSLPIAWRRAHQGVLIRGGRTAVITGATAVRLCTLAGSLYLGLLLLPDKGAIIAGLAMVASVTVEAALVTRVTYGMLGEGHFDDKWGAEEASPLGLGGLWRFYQPLMATSLLRQAIRPVLNASIAAAALPRASLAAWPVAWGLAILITGPAWSLQQLATALASDENAYRRVRGFALTLSVLLSLCLAFVAFTPAYGVVMGGVYNLSEELQHLAQPAVQVMVVLPLLMGVQGLLRGVLIQGGATGAVRTAMIVNVLTFAAAILVGLAFLSPTGVMLAAVATLAGGVGELVWLMRERRL
jgi:Na+-driven multidrug efflux pump